MQQTCTRCGKHYYGVGCPDCDFPPLAANDRERKPNRFYGFLFMGIGCWAVVMALAWPQSLPSWPGFIAGVMFFLAGVGMITEPKGRARLVLGGAIFAGFASLGFFGAFGPGVWEEGIWFIPAAWNQGVPKVLSGMAAIGFAAFALWCFYRAVKPRPQ